MMALPVYSTFIEPRISITPLLTKFFTEGPSKNGIPLFFEYAAKQGGRERKAQNSQGTAQRQMVTMPDLPRLHPFPSQSQGDTIIHRLLEQGKSNVNEMVWASTPETDSSPC